MGLRTPVTRKRVDWAKVWSDLDFWKILPMRKWNVVLILVFKKQQYYSASPSNICNICLLKNQISEKMLGSPSPRLLRQLSRMLRWDLETDNLLSIPLGYILNLLLFLWVWSVESAQVGFSSQKSAVHLFAMLTSQSFTWLNFEFDQFKVLPNISDASWAQVCQCLSKLQWFRRVGEHCAKPKIFSKPQISSRPKLCSKV